MEGVATRGEISRKMRGGVSSLAHLLSRCKHVIDQGILRGVVAV